MKRTVFAGLLTLIAATGALADDNQRMAAVTEPLVKKECSACHMAFQPGFLPAASWTAIMADLPNHFGEDASLPPETARQIEGWLVANAADAGGRAMRGIDPAKPPLRITELAWWKREHEEEVSAAARKKAGSMANCLACHKGADQGVFEDD